MKQMELESRFLKHCITNPKALDRANAMRITAEHLNATDEGSEVSYTQKIYQIVANHYKDSGGDLCTDYVFETTLASVRKLKSEHRQNLMLVWAEVQEEDYDENDLYAILKQIKMGQAMRLVKQCSVDGAEVLLTNGIAEWLDHQTLYQDQIREELKMDESEKESFDFAKAGEFFEEDYGERRDNPEKYLGIPIGIEEIDEAWGGLKKGQLYTILAPTGGGKSVFLLNWAHHAWKCGKNVLYLSFELMKHQCLYRHMSLALHVPFWKFDKIKLTNEEFDMCVTMLNKQSENGAYFHYSVPINDPTPEYVEAKVRELVANGLPAPDLIVADYVGEMTTRSLMASNKEIKHWEKGEAAAEGLWKLGLRSGIAILTAGQFTQDAQRDRAKSLREGKLPMYDTSTGGGSKKLTDRSHSVVVVDPDWEQRRSTLYNVKGRDGRFSPIGVQLNPEHNEVAPLPPEDQAAWRELKGLEATTRRSAGDSRNAADSSRTTGRLTTDGDDSEGAVGTSGSNDWVSDEPAYKTDVTELDMSDWELPL